MPGQNTFPRKERITRRKEFLRIYRDGEKRVGRTFICYMARGDGQGTKIGYVVSRKVGGAVVRNRIKRYIREVYRTRRSDLRSGAHVVLVARPESVALDYRQCEASIRQLFRKGDERRG